MRLFFETNQKEEEKKTIKKKIRFVFCSTLSFLNYFLLKGNNIKSDRLWVDLFKKGRKIPQVLNYYMVLSFH